MCAAAALLPQRPKRARLENLHPQQVVQHKDVCVPLPSEVCCAAWLRDVTDDAFAPAGCEWRSRDCVCAPPSPCLAAAASPVPRQGGGALEAGAVAW